MRNLTLATIIILGAAALIFGLGSPVQQAEAQPPDCWIPVYETVTVIQFGIPIQKKEKVDEIFDPRCRFEDDRINVRDVMATATIYCLPDGGVSIWDVNIMSQGEPAVAVTAAEIAAVPERPAENTLIAGIPGISLYRLTSGELQVNAAPNFYGDPEYVFIWGGCTPEE